MLKSLRASRFVLSKPRGKTLRKRQRSSWESGSNSADKPKDNNKGLKSSTVLFFFEIVERTTSRLKGRRPATYYELLMFSFIKDSLKAIQNILKNRAFLN